MARILVGAGDGLHVFDDGRPADVQRIGWDPERPSSVSALAREGTEVWAVLDRHQIWRTATGGWSHVANLGNLDVECMADTVAGMIAGTSQAHLVRVVPPPTPLRPSPVSTRSPVVMTGTRPGAVRRPPARSPRTT